MQHVSPVTRRTIRTGGQPLAQRRLTWAIALLLLFVSGADRTDAENAADNEQASARRRIFGHLLFRDRQQQVALSRARRNLADGQTADGLMYVQTLLDAPQDAFVWLDDESRLASIRSEAMRLLSEQPADVFRTYERLHRAEAETLLAEARRTGDLSRYREVARRFFFTSAGFAAVDWQASRLFDQARFGQAAREWQRLVSTPAHRRRVKRPLLLKTALALQLAGRSGDAKETIARLGTRQVRLGDGTAVDADWLTKRFPAESRPTHRVARTRVQTTTPFLSPRWNQPYSAGPDEMLDGLVGAWEDHQRQKLLPLAVANSAVVADGAVVVRDFGSIRALDAETGTPRWAYRCATSLQTASRQSIASTQVASRAGSTPVAGLDVTAAFAANAVVGTIATDGRLVFAVDYVDLTRPARSPDRFSRQPLDETNRKPRLVSREANRLIALRVKPPPDETDNQRPLWSIGGAVGTPEWFVRMDRDADGRVSKAEYKGSAEKFRQADINKDDAIGLREAAAAAGVSDRGNPLWGHFFLGAPLAVDGRLYAMTEADRQLNLVALRAETGKLLWSQAIGFVEVPIERDAGRYALGCTPSFADGILVCPTQLGLLVGVDASTGALAWAYYYGDGKSLSRLGRWPHRPQRSYGHAGFSSSPHVTGDRVIVLPRHSDSIHCLDLRTGRRLWKQGRQDAEYVGTIHDDRLLVVGSRNCRGLSLESGEELWSSRLGMPSGRGLAAAANYLVPLQEGRIATLDLSTGREIGFTLPRSDGEEDPQPIANVLHAPLAADGSWHPGNLLAVGDLVLSAGTRRLVAFPQAAPLLASIEREHQNRPLPPSTLVRAAELNLALGDVERARDRLTGVLSQPMPLPAAARAETLLRELLYMQISKHPRDSGPLFTQLERLATTPARRGRFLMQRAEAQLRQDDFAGVLASTREFSTLKLNRPLPSPTDSSLRMTAASWVRSTIGRVQHQFDDERRAEISARIDAEQQQALTSAGTARLERFLTLYSSWPQADEPRNELARRHIDAGRFQQAELLLLANRASRNRQTAARATAMLASLWDRLGLWHEAAGQWKRLEVDFADVSRGDDASTRETGDALSADGLTASALKQLERPAWDVARVDVLQRPWTEADPDLAEAYGRYRRRFPTGGATSFQLLVKGTSSRERLAVIDRQTGRVVSQINIPRRVTYPTSSRTAGVGHFVPLGGPGALYGVSLLSRESASSSESGEPLWKTVPTDLASQQDALRVGPSGPAFCSFQAPRELIVADPATGQVIWQRGDLDPNGGLRNDPYAGLFGDDEVLVLFAGDRSSYTVYRTATGEVIRSGQLEIEINQQRRVFGRKLCYVARLETGTRIRVWDPLHDRIEFDEAFEGRLFSAVTPDDELAVILPPGRLVVFDAAAGKQTLNCRLRPSDLANLNYMRIFADKERYFVNLQRAVRVRPSRTYSYYASDTFLDAVHIQGDLLAVDRRTGQIEWKRTLPQRSVLGTPHFRLPFLITVSGVRDRWNGNRRSLLVEVIDRETGETIGRNDNIRPDRIVGCNYDPSAGRIELHGLKSLVELRFDRARQRLTTDDLPL